MAATLKILPVEPQKQAKSSRAREGGQSEASAGVPGPSENANLAKKLADLLTADDLAGAVTVWREGLTAVKKVWSAKLQRYEDGGPDWQIRRDMAEAIAAYMEGRPLERQMNISGTFVELRDMLSQMKQSGEAARLLPGLDSLPSASLRRE